MGLQLNHPYGQPQLPITRWLIHQHLSMINCLLQTRNVPRMMPHTQTGPQIVTWSPLVTMTTANIANRQWDSGAFESQTSVCHTSQQQILNISQQQNGFDERWYCGSSPNILTQQQLTDLHVKRDDWTPPSPLQTTNDYSREPPGTFQSRPSPMGPINL